jgi:hypothetical protein
LMDFSVLKKQCEDAISLGNECQDDIFSWFQRFLYDTPASEKDLGWFGFYLFQDALWVLQSIKEAINDGDYNWFDDLSLLRTFVGFYEDYPCIERTDDWIEYESTFTDYRYYEDLNSLISGVEKVITDRTEPRNLFNDILLCYNWVRDLMLKIADFHNDANIFLELFISKNRQLFNDLWAISIHEAWGFKEGRTITLANWLKYNLKEKYFYKSSKPNDTYSIAWLVWEKFMWEMCRKNNWELVTYDDLERATWKGKKEEVQTIYKNLKTLLEVGLKLDKTVSDFCTNIKNTWYKLKRK